MRTRNKVRGSSFLKFPTKAYPCNLSLFFKATPWDHSYFWFLILYTTDHDFIYFRISRFLWMQRKPKQTICIPKHLLKDCCMFLQHWASCWCRRPSVEQTNSAAGTPPAPPPPPPVIAFPDQLRAAAIDVTRWLLFMSSETVSLLCCMMQYDYNIRFGNRASFVFFSALTLVSFCIFIYWGRLGFIKINFQNWQNWQLSSHEVPLNRDVLFQVGINPHKQPLDGA